MTKVFLALWLVALSVNATDWYCRPSGGSYGAEDGTTYETAWDGLMSVVWGGSGVQGGDILYICGAHLHTIDNPNNLGAQALVSVTASGTQANPITIRMDYPGDTGEVYGCFSDQRPLLSWEGPDANGVYFQINAYNYIYKIMFEQVGTLTAGGTNVVLLNRETNTTWEANLGTAYFQTGDGVNQTNFVKTISGDAPTSGVLCKDALGYRFNLGSVSNITWKNCRFFATVFEGDSTGYDLHCNNITFTNCVFRYGCEFSMRPGWDAFTFDHCQFTWGKYGVYGYQRDGSNAIQPTGPNNATITDCTFSDMGSVDAFYHQDAHAISAQAGSGWLIENNDIRRTGTAIEMYAISGGESNNIIRFNFIQDIFVCSVTTGNGIMFSGTQTTVGNRMNNQVYGNIVANVGVGGSETYHGSGIALNSKDPVFCCNNTVVGSTNGIQLASTGGTVSGTVNNNVLLSSTAKSIYAFGDSITVDCDYNLFDVDTSYFLPETTHDTHSVTADPLFVSASPYEPADFRLQSGSPAIRAGTPVGLDCDIAGQRWHPTQPSIGAYETAFGTSRSTTTRATTLRGR